MLSIISNIQPFTDNIIDFYKIRQGNIFDGFNENIFGNHIIMFAPLIINNKYYSIYKLWLKFLAKEYPEKKLVVFGLRNFKHSNYIDFLKFPKDLNKKIKNAVNVNELFHSLSVKDKTKSLFPTDGEDVYDKIELLFKGHSGDGIPDIIKDILPTAEILLKADNIYVYKEVLLKEFEMFFRRWRKYELFYKYLPYYPTIHEVDVRMKKVYSYFKKEKLNRNKTELMDIIDNLKFARRKLTEIYRKYFE